MRGGSCPHHLDSASPGILEIPVHRFVPLFGNQRQFLCAAGWMIAYRPYTKPACRKCHAQLQIELIVNVHDFEHTALRHDADFHLTGRFQRNTVPLGSIPHIFPIDQYRRIVRLLHLPQYTLYFRKSDRFPAGMGDKVLYLQPQGQLSFWLASLLEILNQ